MAYRAVIFDLGGVVFPSPFAAFRAYEEARGLPHRFISEVVVSGGEHGAWSRFERGELDRAAFAEEFGAECQAAGYALDVDDFFASFRSGGAGEADGGNGFNDVVVAAIRVLRREGLRTAALTNNWVEPDGTTSIGSPDVASRLDGLFDVVVESAVVGLRKPDPRVYELVLEQLGISATEAVFLDDLGANLKPARAMGMATVKVTDPHVAVTELAAIVGLDLLDPTAD